MSESDKLSQIAKLVGFKFDKQALRYTIKSFSKHPKMIGIAALFTANNMKLIDDEKVMKIETTHGLITIPKDGSTDGYRIQDAAISKVKGGKNMILLPKIDGVMVDKTPNQKWAFKEAYDLREPGETGTIWGGDFQTVADDYLDENDEFVAVPIPKNEHYFNIVMSNRDAKDFKEKNPEFFFKDCTEDCMKRAHVHAVHGFYSGAFVHGYVCAPPLYLHPTWKKVGTLNPENARVVDAAVDRAATVFQPLADAVARDAPARGFIPSPRRVSAAGASAIEVLGRKVERWAGAETLLGFINNPDSSWQDVLDCFRDPKTAKWASSSQLRSSKAGQEKIKKGWNKLYQRDILPMVEGEGSPFKDVLEAVWDADKNEAKFVACYFMRRLTEGKINVCEDQHGYITKNEED